MVREETQREKLRCRASRRAWGYEKRLEERGGSGLGRECRGEMKKRLTGGRIKSEWEKERENFWENRGIDIREIEEGRDGSGRILEEVWGETGMEGYSRKYYGKIKKSKEEKDGRR